MRATLTFSNVYDSDLSLTGSAGHDLARAHRLSKKVPPSFIVTSNVFNEFMNSSLTQKIRDITVDGVADPKKLKGLFAKATIPKDILFELQEAYESLDVESLLKNSDPVVNLFLSPDYYF